MPNLSVLCITPFIADLLLKSLSLPYIACIICNGQFFSISLRPLISYSMEKFVSHALELQFLILTYKKTSKFTEYKNFKCKIYLFLPWMSYDFGCITHKSWLFHLHVKRKSLMWQQLWKTFFFLMTTSNTSIPWMIGSLLNSMVI